TIYRFYVHGRELASLLSVDRAHRGRYIRLAILASTDLFLSIPLDVWQLHGNAKVVRPWVSWQTVHADFSAVTPIPTALWTSDAQTIASLEVTRWSTVLCGFLFFALFGTFSQEAREHYRSAYRFTRSRMGQAATRTVFAPRTFEQYVHVSQNFGDIFNGASSLPQNLDSWPRYCRSRSARGEAPRCIHQCHSVPCIFAQHTREGA
ncbi:STE3-domain-containing protein, partial [Artomyces pyxidatus]